jgi:anhydro-N-acetylmuramic acid kinase
VIVVAVASGTSADGLDVGVADLRWDGDGGVVLDLRASFTEPWPEGVREAVLGLLPPATTTAMDLCAVDTAVGQAVGQAARRASERYAAGAADLVVSPGQTVAHDVRDGRCHGTLQVGQPAWVVQATGLPVVSDLRARDVADGGHGAPLASTLDSLWLSGPGGPRAALNLGGIANVTVLGAPGQPVLAWDTGPANCLLDVAAARVTGGRERYDAGGRLAAAGTVRPDLLDLLLAHPYFTQRPPCSTGRETFSESFLDECLAGLPAVGPADLLATLTELTAVTVARALAPYGVTEVVASGGGVENPALMAALARRLGGTRLVTSDERGLPARAKEVAMWALLGFLTWHGLPGPVGATGSATPRVLGRISPGDRPLRLPEPATAMPRRLLVSSRAAEVVR